MDRPVGVVLRRTILSARSCCSVTRDCVAGRRRLPRDTWRHGSPRVHLGGDVAGRAVLVQGAAAIGMCAAALARHTGAHVIGTVRSSSEEPGARTAGAHEVIVN